MERRKVSRVLVGLLLWEVVQGMPGAAVQSKAVIVPVAGDGIQRIEITIDSYSFTPNRLIVRRNVPVELILKSVTLLISHNFALRAPEAGVNVEVEVSARGTTTVLFTPKATGTFRFVCTKKPLLFKSHEEEGMVGFLEVVS